MHYNCVPPLTSRSWETESRTAKRAELKGDHDYLGWDVTACDGSWRPQLGTRPTSLSFNLLFWAEKTVGRIFISHAAADTVLIDRFVDLLQTGLDISRTRIFCTSIEGMKIRPGKTFVEYIRQELTDSDYVIMVITAAYYESAFCLCELGATWVLGREACPLLVPPIDVAGMKAVLSGVQAGKIGDSDALNAMKDHLEQAGFGNAATGRWEAKRNAFLKMLPKLLKAIPEKTLISASEFKTLQAANDESQKLLAEQQEKIDGLNELVEQLKSAKDDDEVSRIVMDSMDEPEAFETLWRDLRALMRDLPAVAIESMYYVYRSEFWQPDSGWGTDDLWERIYAAEERGMIKMDGPKVIPNDEHPKIKRVIGRIDQLESFLASADERFIQAKEEENEFQMAITNRDFWKKYLSLR
jgi:hypothetical protein